MSFAICRYVNHMCQDLEHDVFTGYYDAQDECIRRNVGLSSKEWIVIDVE